MIEGQEGVTWEQWVKLARAAEDSRLEGLFRSDHYLSLFGGPGESLDAWSTITALAAVTDRIRLGTNVSPVAFRHPAHLAKVVAAADHISGGRVELGLGAGWFEEEHRVFGFDFPEPGQRFAILEEQIEIIHRLWTGEQLRFDGRWYRLEGGRTLPPPVQRPHPPLILGGLARPRAAALAARWADEYNFYDTAPEGVGRKRDRLRKACEAIGRDPDGLRLSVVANTLVGEDHRELTARAQRHMTFFGQTGDVTAYLAGLGAQLLVGSPQQVIEQLARYAAAGIDRVLIQHYLHDDLEMVELIGKAVVPALSG